jgi:hypothetical protein
MYPHTRPERGPTPTCRVGRLLFSARWVQARGGRSMRYRTPDCGGASRATSVSGASTGGGSSWDGGVSTPVATLVGASRSVRRAGPSARRKMGSSVSQGAAAARRIASSGASRAGAAARAVAPRSSQKGAKTAALAGRPSVHTASKTPAKIAVRNTLVAIERAYFGSAPRRRASHAGANNAQQNRKRRFPTRDRFTLR